MSRSTTISRGARIVALLVIQGACFSTFAQQVQDGKSPKPSPKVEAPPPVGTARAGGVVPGSLAAASKAASEALAEMQKASENPPPVDMPDAPLADQPKKP